MPNIARLQAGDPSKPLTDRQRRFVEEYMVDLNATAAAVRAGYSRRTSGLYTALMGLPHVKAAIEAGLAEKRGRAAWVADRVIEELAAIAFCNVQDFVRPGADGAPVVDVWNCERAAAAAVARVTLDYGAGNLREDEGASTPSVSPSMTPSHLPRERGRSGRPVRRVSVSLADKVSALKTLAKVLGLGRVDMLAAGEVDAVRRDGKGQPRRPMPNLATGLPRWIRNADLTAQDDRAAPEPAADGLSYEEKLAALPTFEDPARPWLG